MNDQQLVESFTAQLSRRIGGAFRNRIDFIILFGSAARGEFIRGASDIDLLIQVKDEEDVSAVKKFATSEFWKLNKKYDAGFERSCSFNTSKTVTSMLLRRLELTANLYTPLFVYGPKDLDWEVGRVRKPSLLVGANLFASQSTIFQKFKSEGKLYYGRDIRKVIHPHHTWWERWKGILIPQHLTLFGLFISPVAPHSTVKYCNKAILYEIDSALVYLKKFKKRDRNEKIKSLKAGTEINLSLTKGTDAFRIGITGRLRLVRHRDYKIIDEALTYKISGFFGTPLQAIGYAMRSLWFIIRLNWSVIIIDIIGGGRHAGNRDQNVGRKG